ncbi:MAG: hypothetical protein ACLR4Z_10415 [Butyricicoccaceae bacterium]
MHRAALRAAGRAAGRVYPLAVRRYGGTDAVGARPADAENWEYADGALHIPMDTICEKHFETALRHLEARIRSRDRAELPGARRAARADGRRAGAGE